MKRTTLIATLIGGYVVFLVASAPAWIATERIAAVTQGTVEFVAPEGSVWRGAASMRIAGTPLERVEWSFQPQRLLFGELAYALRVADPAANGAMVAARGFTDWRFHELSADAQAGLVARWLPLLGAFAPGGQMRVDAQRLAFDGKSIEGQAKLQWLAAELSVSDVRPLGDYSAEVTMRGGGADYTVKTQAGTLRLAGRGTFQPPMRWTFQGEAAAAPDALPRLQGILKLMGAVNTNANGANDKGLYVINHGPR